MEKFYYYRIITHLKLWIYNNGLLIIATTYSDTVQAKSKA